MHTSIVGVNKLFIKHTPHLSFNVYICNTSSISYSLVLDLMSNKYYLKNLKSRFPPRILAIQAVCGESWIYVCPVNPMHLPNLTTESTFPAWSTSTWSVSSELLEPCSITSMSLESAWQTWYLFYNCDVTDYLKFVILH